MLWRGKSSLKQGEILEFVEARVMGQYELPHIVTDIELGTQITAFKQSLSYLSDHER